MVNVTTAAEFFSWRESLGDRKTWTDEQVELRTTLFKSLPEQERYLVHRKGVAERFVPENLRSLRSEELSPSGKYRLTVSSYSTSPGSWDYTRGEVYRVFDGVKVADVKRNYSSFYFTWMENHVNGHDYLIAGEDYQGQIFCELDTGNSKAYIPDDAFEGAGFCWADMELLPDNRTLKVLGCYWACPYEYRFYDVSDPLSGWAELSGAEDVDFSDDSGVKVFWQDGGIVWERSSYIWKATGETALEIENSRYKLFRGQVKAKSSGDEEALQQATQLLEAHDVKYDDHDAKDNDPSYWDSRVEHRIKVVREGNNLVKVEEWKSEAFAKLEQERDQAAERHRAQQVSWRDSDPICAELATIFGEDVRNSKLGFSYPSVNMVDGGEPNPVFFHFRFPNESSQRSTYLKWGVLEGPLTLECWTYGTGSVETSYSRDIAGLVEAWSASIKHLHPDTLSRLQQQQKTPVECCGNNCGCHE